MLKDHGQQEHWEGKDKACPELALPEPDLLGPLVHARRQVVRFHQFCTVAEVFYEGLDLARAYLCRSIDNLQIPHTVTVTPDIERPRKQDIDRGTVMTFAQRSKLTINQLDRDSTRKTCLCSA